MNHVVLIGTSHQFQRGHPSCSQEEEQQFVDFIQAVCLKYRVAAVGEEMSAQLMIKEPRSETTCATVASRLGLQHTYCEPLPQERAALGIQDKQSLQAEALRQQWPDAKLNAEIRHSFELRESYWLRKLEEMDLWPVVFVCGADHVDSFQAKLNEAGHSIFVAYKDWSPGHGSN